MRRWILLLLALLILFPQLCVFYQPGIPESSQITKSATVVDRAMSDGLPYLGLTLEDGTAFCLWDLEGDLISEDVKTGDSVTVTYAKQDGFDRYILIRVTK